MTRVAIIGAGEIGAITARALASLECASTVCLIDPTGSAAAGKALDILQAAAIEGTAVDVIGGTDIESAAGVDVVVLADRHGADVEWEGDAGIELVRRLLEIAPVAPVLFAGSRHRELIARAVRELGAPRRRLVGSAPEALVSAGRALVAVTGSCSALDVALAVVGMPDAWIAAWNECTIAGIPAVDVLPPHALRRVEHQLAASWPPGPYSLGSSAARCAAAILGSSRRRRTVYAVLDGEYDVRRVVAAVPVVLGPTGVREVHPPALSTRERVALETALARG